MSETLRVGLVAEGVTDYEVLRAAVASMLGTDSFILTLLQPEESLAFQGGGHAGPLGGGWKGVYKWCRQTAARSGRVSEDPLVMTYDILVVHLDAEVAEEDPAQDSVAPLKELAGVLPCARPCPPPDATTNELRRVMLSWLDESTAPQQLFFCMPSMNTEAWVVFGLFSADPDAKKSNWECRPHPENRLGQQSKAIRVAKRQEDYRSRSENIKAAWPRIEENLSEARRFATDFRKALTLRRD